MRYRKYQAGLSRLANNSSPFLSHRRHRGNQSVRRIFGVRNSVSRTITCMTYNILADRGQPGQVLLRFSCLESAKIHVDVPFSCNYFCTDSRLNYDLKLLSRHDVFESLSPYSAFFFDFATMKHADKCIYALSINKDIHSYHFTGSPARFFVVKGRISRGKRLEIAVEGANDAREWKLVYKADPLSGRGDTAVKILERVLSSALSLVAPCTIGQLLMLPISTIRTHSTQIHYRSCMFFGRHDSSANHGF